jgi:hypothetical protein
LSLANLDEILLYSIFWLFDLIITAEECEVGRPFLYVLYRSSFHA